MLASAILTGGYIGKYCCPSNHSQQQGSNWFSYISVIYTSTIALLPGIIVLISFSKGCSCHKPEATCNSNGNEDIMAQRRVPYKNISYLCCGFGSGLSSEGKTTLTTNIFAFVHIYVHERNTSKSLFRAEVFLLIFQSSL